jgi:hypothetical protein
VVNYLVNYTELKDHLRNLVEFTCTQYINEIIFYALEGLAENMCKYQKLEI